jgi:hypothetical protein
MKNNKFNVFLAILTFGMVMLSGTFASNAYADPYKFTFTSTVSSSLVPGVLPGDPVTLEVIADNGNNTSISQEWWQIDVVSAKFMAGDTYIAEFFAPFDFPGFPKFETDDTGALTSALFYDTSDNNSDNLGGETSPKFTQNAVQTSLNPINGDFCQACNIYYTPFAGLITSWTIQEVGVSTYSVGGNISGLTGTGLVLQINDGETLAVAAADTAFTFTTELPDLAAYAVTVSTQPTGQTCTVTNSSGAIAAADVTDVAVDCVDDVVVVPPTPAMPVPTLSQWALIMLSMLLGLMVFANRRRLF